MPAQPSWDRLGAEERARILNRAADLYEEHRDELIDLCVREGGRTIPDCISELREAVDFMRYYGAQAKKHFGEPVVLPGPTGERNTYSMRGSGVFICDQPVELPAGHLHRPGNGGAGRGQRCAGETGGADAIDRLSGDPADCTKQGSRPSILHFVPGGGRLIGGRAVADPRVAGVVFTGSTEVAQTINQTLAHRDGPIGT